MARTIGRPPPSDEQRNSKTIYHRPGVMMRKSGSILFNFALPPERHNATSWKFCAQSLTGGIRRCHITHTPYGSESDPEELHGIFPVLELYAIGLSKVEIILANKWEPRRKRRSAVPAHLCRRRIPKEYEGAEFAGQNPLLSDPRASPSPRSTNNAAHPCMFTHTYVHVHVHTDYHT